MEIIIPTNDGLAIAPDFENASSFRQLTVINGTVTEDSVQPAETIGSLQDKQIIITRGILPLTENRLKSGNFEIYLTPETNIINALMAYLKEFANMESNYCCCP